MLVFTTKSFNKDISKIRDKKLAIRVEQAIKAMEAVKSVSEISGIKKMAGAHNAYRVRIGEYRLGLFLIDNGIRLTIFANRKDIYKFFP